MSFKVKVKASLWKDLCLLSVLFYPVPCNWPHCLALTTPESLFGRNCVSIWCEQQSKLTLVTLHLNE